MGQKSGLSIRSKLWLAFGSVAATTLLATVIALHGFNTASKSIQSFSQRGIPIIKSLSNVAQQGHVLLGAIPSMAFANTTETLNAAILKVDTAEEGFIEAQQDVDKVISSFGMSQEKTQINNLSARIAAHLQILQSALLYRQNMAQRGKKIVKSLRENDRRYAEIMDLKASDFALHILHAPLEKVQIFDTEIQKRVPEQEQVLRAQLKHIRGLRHAELISTELASRQLERIRVLGTFLDVEIDRQLKHWHNFVTAEDLRVQDSLNINRWYLIAACAAAIIGAFGIGWLYLGRNIVTRLIRIDSSMRAIANNDFDTPIPSEGNDEIARMGATLSVFRDAMERIAYLAHHDALTGLLNRHGFTIQGHDIIHQHPKGCLIYLNLQAFKEINDTFGHEVGDRILIATSECIDQLTPRPALLARLGGDDFAILLPDVDLENAIYHARAIQNNLRHITVDGAAVSDLHAVFGIAQFPIHGVSTRMLVQRADMAMNDARSTHTAAIRAYEDTLGQAAEYRKILRSELHQALDENQFFLHYQPQVDINTRHIVGAEALVRWNHPARGMISPADFIPIAERSGFIRELGFWVLQEACKQLRRWQDMHMPLTMAVNVSALQILDPNVVSHIENALDSSGISSSDLEIEITESIFLRDESDVLARLRELRENGLDLALDDFGTGYSSLSYLKRLPVSTLKIDQSFVREMFVGNDDTRITSAIIQMAHSLNLKVVAEGIENERQLDFFQNAGCDIGQGFLFSRPLSVEDFESFYKTHKETGGQ